MGAKQGPERIEPGLAPPGAAGKQERGGKMPPRQSP